ncbi:hypothetical protein MB02_12540 [Croceicoccus estronivorus]|uniref:Rieske 2Fe-2S domain-containing protein n=1 Tax=Croceicoccus estronivorus TaxID=1172626 RepID=UPI0008366956|nr:Rieske 2Fe-2S domain-containing protein [Croceicoccus estronivorus]OCC23434.1 hypothetical protein MB02_12540 [Croceicoccus estronivorus]
MLTMEALPMHRRAPDIGFPRGWYCVAESEKVTADEMLPVSYLDEQFIVYRGPDGTAHVADAFCPHLGAHLATLDGSISEGKITCPFHKWSFDGATGRCVDIPYTKVMVPGSVKLKVYPTREIDGMVLAWYHPEGEEPDFEPWSRESLDVDAPWIPHSTTFRESTCPYRDLFENLFDTAHVQQLHGSNFLPTIESMERTSFGMHARFSPPTGERFPVTGLENMFTGVSLMTQLVTGDGFGFLQSVSATPIDHERFVQVSRLYVRDMGSPELNEALGKPFADNTAFETDKDFKVLDFKKHLARPQLCAGDGPIMKWRSYQEEFYA